MWRQEAVELARVIYLFISLQMLVYQRANHYVGYNIQQHLRATQ